MVFIDAKKIVCLHVADEVRTQDPAGAEFPLDTDVHLNGARRLVVRVVGTNEGPDALFQ